VAAVALAVFMPTVSLAVRTTQPDARPITVVGVLLLIGSGLAIALRRTSPVAAFGLSVGLAVAFLGLRYAGWPVYIGAFAGLVLLVSDVSDLRLWAPLAAAGGVAVAVATGPPENWQPTRMVVIGVIWAVVAALAARAARTRRLLAEREATNRVIADRFRIARELHDVLSHSLASVSLQAGVALHLLDEHPEETRTALRAIRQISGTALAEARVALSTARDPDAAADTGVAANEMDAATNPRIEPAAHGLADLPELAAAVRASGLDVALRVEVGDADVPEAVGMATYRVVQESLTNAMRHAGSGARVRTTVAVDGTSLRIDITDDGGGSPATALATGQSPGSGGHGLTGMAERVSMLGGRLNAGPLPDGGFQVLADIPLEA
jgi:signal transduction histidine kinase